jgi:hypothetical protein
MPKQYKDREDGTPGESPGSVHLWIGPLADLYQFRDYTRVEAFLTAHPYLEKLLLETHGKIREYFGQDASAALEVFTDCECDGEDEGPLFAIIQTNLTYCEASGLLDRLDEEWWLDALPRGEGNLIVSMDFV